MIDLKNKSNSLFESFDGKTTINLQLKGYTVPVKFLYSEKCKYLLISFHGALNRSTRNPPIFSPIMPGISEDIAQLSVSDPLMLSDGKYEMTWYAGSEKFPTQTVLFELFNKIIKDGEFKRVVFCGTSGGGFAALYFSSLFSGSIAIPGAPQTNIFNYYSGHVQRYIEGCWPNLSNIEELKEKVCVNLCDWYLTERSNTVIYLQSSGDHFHTRTQLVPFISAIACVKNARYIVNSDFWGTLAHSRSVPISAFKPWVQAAFLAPTIEVDDLLLTYYGLKQLTSMKLADPLDSNKKTVVPDGISMANLLRDHHLRQQIMN